jgi:hypothetical protein
MGRKAPLRPKRRSKQPAKTSFAKRMAEIHALRKMLIAAEARHPFGNWLGSVGIIAVRPICAARHHGALGRYLLFSVDDELEI